MTTTTIILTVLGLALLWAAQDRSSRQEQVQPELIPVRVRDRQK
ncbi:hypothetical protein [Oxynema sp. CENA135]|nr:hypothetical protein [Oxynema sp. CENA135]